MKLKLIETLKTSIYNPKQTKNTITPCKLLKMFKKRKQSKSSKSPFFNQKKFKIISVLC